MIKAIAVLGSAGVTAGVLYAVATPGVGVAHGGVVGLIAGIVAGAASYLLERR